MCDKSGLDILLAEAKNKLSSLFGNKLLKVVLYGSYARGDYDSESDIDVMALVDMDKNELQKYRRTVSELANDIDLKHGVLLSVKLQDNDTFVKYQNVLPLYKNITKEGVDIGV